MSTTAGQFLNNNGVCNLILVAYNHVYLMWLANILLASLLAYSYTEGSTGTAFLQKKYKFFCDKWEGKIPFSKDHWLSFFFFFHAHSSKQICLYCKGGFLTIMSSLGFDEELEVFVTLFCSSNCASTVAME